MHTRMKIISDEDHWASARAVVLYDLFPQLTAGLGGYVYTTDSI